MIPKHFERSTTFFLLITTAYLTYYFHSEITAVLTYVDLNIIKPHEVVWKSLLLGIGIAFFAVWIGVLLKWFWWEPRQERKLRELTERRRKEKEKQRQRKEKAQISQMESAMQDCFIMFLLEERRLVEVEAKQ